MKCMNGKNRPFHVCFFCQFTRKSKAATKTPCCLLLNYNRHLVFDDIESIVPCFLSFFLKKKSVSIWKWNVVYLHALLLLLLLWFYFEIDIFFLSVPFSRQKFYVSNKKSFGKLILRRFVFYVYIGFDRYLLLTVTTNLCG